MVKLLSVGTGQLCDLGGGSQAWEKGQCSWSERKRKQQDQVFNSVARLERSFHQVPGEGIKERNSSREVHTVCLGVWCVCGM